jgi:hypothetical protein
MIRGFNAQLASSTALTMPQMEFGKKSGKGGMGKLGLIVGAVAAIAVPFIAPAIAPALFGASFGSSIIGQAIVGAGLGALGGAGAAAISGGDVMRTALFGAAGGALGGGVGGALRGGTLLGTSAAAGLGGTAAAGLSGTAAAAGTGAGLTGASSLGGGLAATAGLTGTTAAAAGTGAAGLTGTGLLGTAVTTVGGQMVSRLTQGLLNAAPQLVAQTVTQMSAPDQAEYLAELEKEMDDYKGRDEEGYTARLNLYNQFLTQARNINPLLDAQLAEARVKRQQSSQYQQVMSDLALTDRNPNAKEFASRKFAVEAPLNQFAAFADAYQRGNERQNSAFSTAAGLYPENYNSGVNAATNMYTIAQAERDKVAEGAGQMAGLLLAPLGSNYKREENPNLYTIG